MLVHGWEAWGRGLLERIDGMFAFGLWDARQLFPLLESDTLSTIHTLFRCRLESMANIPPPSADSF